MSMKKLRAITFVFILLFSFFVLPPFIPIVKATPEPSETELAYVTTSLGLAAGAQVRDSKTWCHTFFAGGTGFNLTAVNIKGSRYSDPINVTLGIRAVNTTTGWPTGNDLANVTVLSANFPLYPLYNDWVWFNFTSGYYLTKGETYALVLSALWAVGAPEVYWAHSGYSKDYQAGQVGLTLNNGTTWSMGNPEARCALGFQVWGYPNVTTSLITNIQAVANAINWNYYSDDASYASQLFMKLIQYQYCQITTSQLASWASNITKYIASSYPYGVFEIYQELSKYGIENQTTIQWALDNATVMANGLPDTRGGSKFWLADRFALAAFNYSQAYSYDTSKWNLSKAYDNFKWAIENQTDPVLNITVPATLYVTSTNGTYVYWSYGGVIQPRFYDELAQTMDVLLKFYQLGIPTALNETETVWNWCNTYNWLSDEYGYPAHYGYIREAPGSPTAPFAGAFECETGGFNEIALKLLYYEPTEENITRLATDISSRYLSTLWSSPQWIQSVIIHAAQGDINCTGSTINFERRLPNDIMAWSAMLGDYPNMTSEQRTNITSLLEGYDNYSAAWFRLLTVSDLFNGTAFREVTYEPSSAYIFNYPFTTDMYPSAEGLTLLLHLGIVPGTAVLAMPLSENRYEDWSGSMGDAGMYAIDLTNHVLQVPIDISGTCSFLYNATVSYTFSSQGLWNVTFDSNWNTILSATRIGDLPANRLTIYGVYYPAYYQLSMNANPVALTPYVSVNASSHALPYTFNMTANTYLISADTSTVYSDIIYNFDHWLVNDSTSYSTPSISLFIDGNTTFVTYYASGAGSGSGPGSTIPSNPNDAYVPPVVNWVAPTIKLPTSVQPYGLLILFGAVGLVLYVAFGRGDKGLRRKGKSLHKTRRKWRHRPIWKD